MLKAGYNVKVSAGAITAGGCLGILIPPSVLLIVYGATAGVSVVQLYAGAFFPGFMLAVLYIGYVIVLAKWRPELMPPLSAERAARRTAGVFARRSRRAAATHWSGCCARRGRHGAVPARTALGAAHRLAAARARARRRSSR